MVCDIVQGETKSKDANQKNEDDHWNQEGSQSNKIVVIVSK